MCWVGFMARSLKEIAERLEEEDDIDDYTKEYKNIVANLNGKLKSPFSSQAKLLL
jgi:hypothetical protein